MNVRLRSQSASWTVAALLVLATSLVACVDEKIVFRDAPRFQNPPATAGNYLGYTDTTTKATACGSCHVGIQAEWRGTAHASAFASLPANAQAFCQACHAVGSLGNADTSSTGGWPGSRDPRYKDVQCENCHNAGLTHASNPTSANIPLPSMNVDTAAASRRGTCGECHAGTHHPYLSEWRSSAHGAMPNWSSPKTRPECQACHTGQGALRAMGVDAVSNYREKNFAAGTDTLRITCAVCHDPHANSFTGQLRLSVADADPERNLCMKCHNRRAVPEISSQTRGPHSAEGPLVVGTAGWEPPGVSIPAVPATHGSQTANPRLCATCHVTRFTVNDAAGAFSYQVTGHGFNAAPCVDATGKPTVAQNCAYTATARNLNSCATSGCHTGGPTQAATITTSRTATIQTIGGVLRGLLNNSALNGQIVQNSVYTVAEGARFNWLLAFDSLTGGPVGGAPKVGALVHNGPRVEALLNASIVALRAAYPALPQSLTAQEQAVLDESMRRTGVKLHDAKALADLKSITAPTSIKGALTGTEPQH
jgi:predicted CXXCH cytochrome family protein